MLEGRDLIAAAKTILGKTAAFSLPTMDKLRPSKGSKGPLMLVVTHRELAGAIGRYTAPSLEEHAPSASSRGRRRSYNTQIKRSTASTDCSSPPDRLVDLMDQGAAREQRGSARTREADHMLDLQALAAMRTSSGATPPKAINPPFSATIDRTIDTAGKLLRPAMVGIAPQRAETADTVEQRHACSRR